MSDQLLRDHEYLLRCALERTESKQESVNNVVADKHCLKKTPKKPECPNNAALLEPHTYKAVRGSAQYHFGLLAKIVKYLRVRYLDGKNTSLTIEEILDATEILRIAQPVMTWLVTYALVTSPRIEVTTAEGGTTYKFKPIYNLKNGHALIRLLKEKGMLGVLLEDVLESLPHYEKELKYHDSKLIIVYREKDNKEVLLYKNCLEVARSKEAQKSRNRATAETEQNNKKTVLLKKEKKLCKENIAPQSPIQQKAKGNKKQKGVTVLFQM